MQKYAKYGAWLLMVLFALFVVYLGLVSGREVSAAVLLGFVSLAFYVYTAKRAYAYRYMFPGLAAVAIFVLMPLAYTIYLGFTNYGSKNLLTFERVTGDLLSETYRPSGKDYNFTVVHDSKEYRLVLTEELVDTSAPAASSEDEIAKLMEEGGTSNAKAAESPAPAPAEKPSVLNQYVTPALALKKVADIEITAVPLASAEVKLGEMVDPKEMTAIRMALNKVRVQLPDGNKVGRTGIDTFGPIENKYRKNPDGTLTDVTTSEVIKANWDAGFYQNSKNENVGPGFRVNAGFANYKYVFTEPKFRGPFASIFAWTVAFSALTVAFTLAVGVFFAVLLNWESLRGRAIYRAIMFLPYAVPGFISILVFKGMFRNAGEINMVINMLFNMKEGLPWITDPFYAKSMLLIVNTWLGYPYMMVLSMGLIRAIPADLYEASAIAGAGPLTNFFKITVPLIVKPITPLLVASFAFNFNNFVLVQLLTAGRPDFLNTDTNAGQTDLLVTYTYKLAFEGGQQFGLAAAISTVIFLIVVAMSLVNMKLTKANAQEQR